VAVVDSTQTQALLHQVELAVVVLVVHTARQVQQEMVSLELLILVVLVVALVVAIT
jgi:hypothetical protein